MQQKGSTGLIVALIGSTIGLGMFTLLTLGVFTTSTEEAVVATLQKPEFTNTPYVVVLPKNMFQQADGASFLKRFKGNTNQLYVCSVSKKQFDALEQVNGVKFKALKPQAVSYDILWFDGDEPSADIFAEITDTVRKEKCVGAETNSFFYIDGPKTISMSGAYRG